MPFDQQGRGVLRVAAAVVLCVAAAGAVRADEAPPDADAEALAARGISPDAEGIATYLRRLAGRDADAKLVDELIELLGHNDYRRREQATQKLLAMPMLPEPALRRATQSDDMEVRCRAEYILAQAAQRTEQPTLLAALRTVRRRRLKGLAAAILKTVEQFPDEAVIEAAEGATAATVGAEDRAALEAAAKTGPAPVRAAAAAGLGGLAGEAAPALRALLADPADRVRLAAARALANAGDRACLSALAELLESEEFPIRMHGAIILRAVTAREFGFSPYAEAEQRRQAAAAWRQWIQTDGKDAKLHFPLAEAMGQLGRTLLCDPQQQIVLEVDAAGKETFQVKAGPSPWAVQQLPDGNVLVGVYGQREVFVVDRKGQTVWKKSELPGGPMSVERLANGNVLAALSDSNQVVEIDPQGRIAWQVEVPGRPADARRLPNGRTLVAPHRANRVVEVDQAGKVVWSIDDLPDPQRVQPLPSGNVLILLTGAGAVAEYDRQGKQVWSRDGFQVPVDAHRLPGGNTLVIDGRGAWEVDPAGKVVWKLERPGLSRAWRH